MAPRWTQGVTFKVLGIGLLALLMLIPLAQVNDLIREREGRALEARAQIAARWGGEQQIAGPVLVVPVRHETGQGSERKVVETREFLLPDRLVMRAKLTPDVRRYGIYETPVYLADLAIEGRFSAADMAALETLGHEVQWQRAELRVPVADVHGIRRVSALRLGTRELEFGPDASGVGGVAAMAATAPLDMPASSVPLAFAFELTLAGSERIAALPLARHTEFHVEGGWPDPGFDGAFLPSSSRVDSRGFAADWQVLDLNRRIAQHWSSGDAAAPDLAGSAFGVSLLRPAGTYQQNVRAGKYGVMFIALTFAAFFLFEVLRKLRVHAVQYVLVGSALCVFYVVLLALSERVGFAMAYLLAAAATVAMIGGYATAVLGGRRAGLVLGALLSLVYALLYGLVVSEDYALLMGALALLATMAALMYLTRHVDWYAMDTARAR